MSLALKSGTDVQVDVRQGRVKMVLKSANPKNKFPGIFLVEYTNGEREEVRGDLIQVRYTTQSHGFAGGE